MRLPISRKKQPALGFFYLIKTFHAGAPPPSLTFPPGKGFNNPYMDGFLARKDHEVIQATYGAPSDFSWLTDIFDFCQANGKLFAIQTITGAVAPPWIWLQPPNGPGAYQLSYGPGANHADHPYTTVGWDPVWQQIWQDLNVEMAAMWDGKCAYVVMSGVGNGSESFLISNRDPQFMANAERAASAFGYPNAVTAWQAGTQWNIDMMRSVWPNTPLVLTTGQPFPPGTTIPEASVALTNMYNYGNDNYRGMFGCRPNDLYINTPHPGDNSVGYLAITSGNCITSGFQAGNTWIKQGDPDGSGMDSALVIGDSFNMHFVEMFPSDPDNPLAIPVMIARRPEMSGIPF